MEQFQWEKLEDTHLGREGRQHLEDAVEELKIPTSPLEMHGGL